MNKYMNKHVYIYLDVCMQHMIVWVGPNYRALYIGIFSAWCVIDGSLDLLGKTVVLRSVSQSVVGLLLPKGWRQPRFGHFGLMRFPEV